MKTLSGLGLVGTLLWAVCGAAQGTSTADSVHLLLRTGFAPTAAELAELGGLDRVAAVERILGQRSVEPAPPDWVETRPFFDAGAVRELPPEERAVRQAEFGRLQRQRSAELRAALMQQLCASPASLVERMTLFWHNHFTSGLQKVPPQLMQRQHQLYRRHALGNFAELLRAVVTDPAMLVYLDGRGSRKAHPNENFARELLELFTLGEGYYGEDDVKAAARAFTGWNVHPASAVATYTPGQHDAAVKVFLGQRGHFGGDDIVAILLRQPRLGEFIVEKLWREFVSPVPDRTEVARLAQAFRDSGYQIKPLLRALFGSDAFWASENRATLVKSPVELLVGAARQIGLPADECRPLALTNRQLGQDLLAPPNVKGWPGHDAWITTATLLARDDALRKLLRGRQALTARIDPRQLAVTLAAAALEPLPSDGEAALIALFTDPAYQLK